MLILAQFKRLYQMRLEIIAIDLARRSSSTFITLNGKPSGSNTSPTPSLKKPWSNPAFDAGAEGLAPD
jgi:hypothetical protein